MPKIETAAKDLRDERIIRYASIVLPANPIPGKALSITSSAIFSCEPQGSHPSNVCLLASLFSIRLLKEALTVDPISTMLIKPMLVALGDRVGHLP
jgi:hypothetical protein